LREIESPAGNIESISRDFDPARQANRRLKLPCKLRSRVAHAVRVIETAESRKHAPKRAIRDIGGW
jgi:hypothetical protein